MTIDIYGLLVNCKCNNSELTKALIRPFTFFRKESSEQARSQVTVEVEEKDPPWEAFPPLPATFSSPRNTVFEGSSEKIIDYFGKGIVVENKSIPHYRLISKDRNFLLEVFYLLVISLFGQHCDRKGLLRVHALAIAFADTAILLPTPPGGGKSTLALSVLEDEDIKLISDDEPVVDRHGAIYPFPVRIGTLDKKRVDSIPPEFIYRINRMEFGPKYFVGWEYWDGQIERRVMKRVVFLLPKRFLGGHPSIRSSSKWKVLRSLIRDAVVGVGLYQGIEFVFQRSGWEILGKLPIALKRLSIAVRLAWRCAPYELTLTRDSEANAQTVKDFVHGLN